MTSRKEGLPSVNDSLSVRKVVGEGGRHRIIRVVDLSKAADPEAPPPDDIAIQGLLQEVRRAKGRKYPEDLFWWNKKQNKRKK